ncbi:MAG: efflux RND transporter permease subunit [Methylotenera sp.]|nr:efflux RND transporter permease subunit [Methylotenera sp.]MDP1755632.1 efflux RND transporter permease subunit [Methylotenera sp.]MDP1959719.1 efflux RND transporter permease subunit [Methylotenera sp.]MDP3206739.1 efflux RND transporter permease subunit [Methylotenera sp.]MDP3302534.1 efflux RND transporter permease subunit [Methylotenera sp.]
MSEGAENPRLDASEQASFNLSAWALKNQVLVLYVMLMLTVSGLLAYTKLGQSEDPPFTFKVMLVRATWPGASAVEVEQQVTDKLEKKIQEVPHLYFSSSYSRPGESVIFVVIKDDTFSKEIPEIWYQVRKKIGDIRHTLPQNIESVTFNDEFSDVFGSMYALTGDGFDNFALKKQAEIIRAELLTAPDVAKIEFFGERKQRVYIEVSNAKLSTLGMSATQLVNILQIQNTVVKGGTYDSPNERIRIEVSGRYNTLEDLREISLRANNQDFKLGDVARVYRGYEDPPRDTVRYEGVDALLLGVSMRQGGDVIALGHNLDAKIAKIKQNLPIGLSFNTVTSQPKLVADSVNDFVKSLIEALVIVLGVSLISLGVRTGIVVAITIPVVLAATFLGMNALDIGLHKISLGALILALGLLVDDAIIAVEMMSSKMEQGWDRAKAASFAYTSTAMPMLTGTLITVAGFLPIATAVSSTGEYTRSIFQVSAIALVISWFAAVIFVPFLGYHLLPDYTKKPQASRFGAWLRNKLKLKQNVQNQQNVTHHHDIYNTQFYRAFRQLVTACVRYRKTVIAITLAMFVLSIIGFGKVQQQFFPDSTRLELVVDLRLTEGASYHATSTEMRKLEHWLRGWNKQHQGIDNFVAYIGTGAPRYYLPLDVQLPHRAFAQLVILSKDLSAREALRNDLLQLFEQDFPAVRASVLRLENGPPVGFPVQFRVDGTDIPKIREISHQIANIMRTNPNLANVQLGWEEPSKVMKVSIDQSKARLLGVSSVDIANLLNAAMSELTITEFREGNERIDLVVRGAEVERSKLSHLPHLMINTQNGTSVPLSQLATLSSEFEEGVIWRRNRVPSITVRANLRGSMQAPIVSAQIEEKLGEIKANLPLGITVETGGAVEESAKGGASVAKGFPLFLVAVLTLLILQLRSFSLTFLVLLTAPLGLIGVTLALLLFDKPFGFVAMLGSIALSGMIMRNSVILVDQIDQDKASGLPAWQAIIESTIRRFRPIVLTAAAAILAMIPLTRSVFFGPMAVAIMGGLAVATLLTVLFLPALYAAWFKVKLPK